MPLKYSSLLVLKFRYGHFSQYILTLNVYCKWGVDVLIHSFAARMVIANFD
jgi:hypothetical protein